MYYNYIEKFGTLMNEYYNLLLELLKTSSITIETPTTEANLRKGLKVALSDYNDGQAMLDMEEEPRVIRISKYQLATEFTPASYKITLVDKQEPRQGSFTFSIVDNAEEKPTT